MLRRFAKRQHAPPCKIASNTDPLRVIFASNSGSESLLVQMIFYVLSTGCQWNALPTDLPAKSTVYDWGWETAHWSASIMPSTSRRAPWRAAKQVPLWPSSTPKAPKVQ